MYSSHLWIHKWHQAKNNQKTVKPSVLGWFLWLVRALWIGTCSSWVERSFQKSTSRETEVISKPPDPARAQRFCPEVLSSCCVPRISRDEQTQDECRGDKAQTQQVSKGRWATFGAKPFIQSRTRTTFKGKVLLVLSFERGNVKTVQDDGKWTDHERIALFNENSVDKDLELIQRFNLSKY